MVMCAVSGCRSNNDKRLLRNQCNTVPVPQNVQFFRFPVNDVLREKWVTSCARPEKFNVNNSYICSKHFKPEDYARNLKHELLNYSPKNSKKLKLFAVPTENMPSLVKKTSDSQNVTQRVAVLSPQEHGLNLQQVAAGVSSAIFPNNNNMQPIVIDESEPMVDSTSLATASTLPMTLPLCPGECNINDHFDIVKTEPFKLYEIKMNFLNHVLMTWLNRGRGGDRRIIMPNSIIKAKAREMAQILNIPIRNLSIWAREFNDLRKIHDAEVPLIYRPRTQSPSLTLEDIVKDEWPSFYLKHGDRFGACDSYNLEDPIETYDEALDCMKLVEDYALCCSKFGAVGLIGQIEMILKEAQSLE